ncbi:MAG: TolC family outer membrane protein [Desulfovibrionaceae bacterium]|nr:TolC family outer membrane protein [Desulfovibrionaceae bacterium]
MPVSASLRDSALSSLHNHPVIKSFQEYSEAALHEVGKARSGWFPRLDARAGYGLRQYSNEDTRRLDQDETVYARFDGELILTQTIWDGLATASRVDINEAKLNSAYSRLFDNSESIGLDAVLAHIEVLRQRQLVDLAENNVRVHERILGSQQERLASGIDTVADVTQTQGRLAQARSTLAGAQGDLQVAMANYRRVTGMEAHELLPPEFPPTAPASYNEALMYAQTNNPKLDAYMSDISAADAEITLAKSGYHPIIYAELGARYLDHVDSSVSWTRSYTALLRADWNLFNGLYDYYNIKASFSRSRQARADYQDIYEGLAKDTRDTWARLEATREQIRFYQQAVDYAKSTTSMYWEQFNIGQRSLLDVLNAENEIFSNSMQLVTARMNEVGSAYRLLALGGRLLESLGIAHSEFEKAEIDAPIIMKNSPVSQDYLLEN